MKLTIAKEVFNVEYTESLDGVSADGEPFITFDTETTGLHLKKDKPFLCAICIGHRVFVFPSTTDNLNRLTLLSGSVRRVYGHNIGYDMHMVANGGSDPLQIKNWGDTMGLARLTVEAKSTRHGGDSLALKALSAKYIDKNADKYEKQVKAWLQAKKRADKKVLTALLKPLGWSASKLEKEDSWPTEVQNVYEEWQRCYPEPTYQDVPMDIMLPYVATDVILTRLLVLKCLPVVVKHEQVEVMEREFRLLPVVYKMERRGIKVDREYLEDCKFKLTDYIEKLYARLRELTGEQWTVGQHAEIKRYYTQVLGYEPPSTDKAFLKKLADNGDEAAVLIGRIRRFEKWLSTYIERILEVSEFDGRFYTQMNQFNPVSGRFSGDLQQMPKDPIYTEAGYKYEIDHPGHKVPKEYILYHPRKAFIPTGNGFDYLYFLDFSQVELRVQAHYTLMFGGDLNMCRAYCPYKCTHYETGEPYSLGTHESRMRWNEKQPDGQSAWLTEDGTPWTPVDVHMATTLKALVAMGYNPLEMSEEELAWWRKIGKRFNFGRNYGMGDLHAAETLEISLDQAKALNQGYTDAFPLVVDYQSAVIKRVRAQGYIDNMYGRSYYLSDWNKAYACANYLIQGSCADDLKIKMVLIDKYLEEHGCKSHMLLCIHDEIVMEVTEDEQWVIPEIKSIMEYTPKIQIPIVAEVEYTNTDWSHKQKWEVA